MLHLDKAKSFGQRKPKVYGGYHKNIAIRFDSTSGGVFSALANTMYKQGGYVSGAVFNEDWSVSNYISNNKKDLSRLPAGFAEKISDATNGKLKVSSEPKNIDGGFILAYGDIEINCSFDALISEKIDVIKDTLNKIIFA